MVRDLELSRDLSRIIVHLDMDMFYAAVEMRDDPELQEKPMAVGGMGMLVSRHSPPIFTVHCLTCLSYLLH